MVGSIFVEEVMWHPGHLNLSLECFVKEIHRGEVNIKMIRSGVRGTTEDL